MMVLWVWEWRGQEQLGVSQPCSGGVPRELWVEESPKRLT